MQNNGSVRWEVRNIPATNAQQVIVLQQKVDGRWQDVPVTAEDSDALRGLRVEILITSGINIPIIKKPNE